MNRFKNILFNSGDKTLADFTDEQVIELAREHNVNQASYGQGSNYTTIPSADTLQSSLDSIRKTGYGDKPFLIYSFQYPGVEKVNTRIIFGPASDEEHDKYRDAMAGSDWPLDEDAEKIKGGLADSKSISDLAKKHNVEESVIEKALAKGIKVEMEHTSDKKTAEEIAKDHIFEDPKYYDKLSTIEEEQDMDGFEDRKIEIKPEQIEQAQQVLGFANIEIPDYRDGNIFTFKNQTDFHAAIEAFDEAGIDFQLDYVEESKKLEESLRKLYKEYCKSKSEDVQSRMKVEAKLYEKMQKKCKDEAISNIRQLSEMVLKMTKNLKEGKRINCILENTRKMLTK